MSYDKIKYYYEAGLWSLPMVKKAVQKGIITKDQFKDITGENYA